MSGLRENTSASGEVRAVTGFHGACPEPPVASGPTGLNDPQAGNWLLFNLVKVCSISLACMGAFQDSKL